MGTNNVDLFLMLHNCQAQRDSKEAISHFRFDGEIQFTEAKFEEVEKGKFRFIKCKFCGHNDFNEDGRFINEYSCNGCDGFLEVTLKD